MDCRVIVRMLNPAAAQLPAVRKLFMMALEQGALAPEVSLARVAATCQNANCGVFIGLEEGEPKALLVVFLPQDPRTDRPLLDLGACWGSSALKREIWAHGMAFAKSAGYNQAWCFNHSGRSDAAYIRGWRAMGHKAKVRSSLIEVDLETENNGRRIDTEREKPGQ